MGQLLPENETWKDWTVEKQIGEGSFGKVYLIKKTDGFNTYRSALKVITIPQNKMVVQSVLNEGMDEKSVTGYFRGIVKDVVNEIKMMSEVKGEASTIVNYEDHQLISYEDDITISKNPIKGINVNPDGVEKFLEFEIIDEFNIPHKLVDIPLYLIDDLTKSKCPFLDTLNSLSIKDIDIYIVGLAYFATYCQDFGELSGNNYYGANIYPRYAGQKMNIAINSSVLNIPLSHYALARYQKNGDIVAAMTEGSKPLKEFMMKQTRQQDMTFFIQLSGAPKPKSPEDITLWQVAPAYILSELKTAFEIGFVIYVPFIVLDLVVANVLLALGMFMLSPTIISLPFKLLIFIAVDGWSMIVHGLVTSFN